MRVEDNTCIGNISEDLIMNNYIAYCGLDCEICEARLATVNNDNDLRIKVSIWTGSAI